MNNQIPDEFLPRKHDLLVDQGEFGTLFEDVLEDGENGANDDGSEKVTIREVTFNLITPPDVGTLFAHRVWSGCKLLAEFLATHAKEYVYQKATVEFGAGTALPSLVALAHGSKASVITDYPNTDVLQCLREAVGRNWATCGFPLSRVQVVGHEWGTSTHETVHTLQSLIPSSEVTSKSKYFDVAILSECLWMHRTHRDLATSVDKLLHPTTGIAILTYAAHHVPAHEKADDHFFEICKEHNLHVIEE